MNIDFNTKVMLEGLKKVEKLLPKSAAIEVYKLIKLCANDKHLFLQASDGNNSVEVKLPTDDQDIIVSSHGGVLLPKTFIEILKKMGSTCRLQVDSKFEATIVSTDSKIKAEMKLNGQDPENYPNFPDISGNPNLVLSGADLISIITKTTFAADTQNTRPVLQGVLFQLTNGKLVVNSTNSHRLAKVCKAVDTNEDLGAGAVVPATSLDELKKILDEREEVGIFFTDSQFVARTTNISFYSRLIQGTYPDVSRIISDPNKAKLSFSANRAEFIQALERILIFLEAGKHSITTIQVKDQELIIENNKKDNGSAKETIFINEISGDEMKISFDTVYVLQALQATDSKIAKFYLTGEMSPFTIYPENDFENINLVLPVRI